MTPDRLLANFDRLADAPDAIPRLRRFILDLAVRGKLVEQNPDDEPASELFRQIQEIRQRLINDGKIRQANRLAPIQSHEVPFSAPESWEWVRLADLTNVLNGRAYKKNELLESGATPVLRVGNLFTSNHWYYSNLDLEEDKYCDKGDLLFAWSASFGPFIWPGPKAIYHYHIWKLNLHSDDHANKHYLYRFLLQKTQEIKAAGHGVSMIHMTKKKMEEVVVPLPPLSEQQRIVARVDELMALCDQLEAAQANRESRRDRLTRASLHRLNEPTGASDADSFHSHTRFVLDHLPRLTTRVEHIADLRQTILNLAVRGKLVPQDPSDEPAVELLKHIQIQKQRLVKEGELKRDKSLPTVDHNIIPYVVPSGWCWARFNDVAAIQSNLVDPKYHCDAPHIAPDNIESGTGRLLDYQTIREAKVFSAKHRFFAGCILYSKIRPSLAKAAIAEFDGLCSADMYPIRPFVDREYLLMYMLSEVFVQQSVSEDTRVAMPKINQAALSKVLVATPPLAEQRRIVVKTRGLLAMCDQLYSRISNSQADSRRLLDAIVHEALAACEGGIPAQVERQALILVGVYLARSFPSSRTGGDRKRMAKAFAIAQRQLGVDFGWHDYRYAAGPHNTELLQQFEREATASELLHVTRRTWNGIPVTDYRPGLFSEGVLEQLKSHLGEAFAELEELARHLSQWTSLEGELYATTHAVWNDLLIDGEMVTDTAIIDGVKDWSDEKRRKYTRQDIATAIRELRRMNLVPSGRGPRTRELAEGLFDAANDVE